MPDQAHPEGPRAACGSRDTSRLLEAAREGFRRHRFAETLALTGKALQQTGEDRPLPAATARELAVLGAWSLQGLRRFEDCRRWLERAEAQGWLRSGDPEAALIGLWMRWSAGEYREVVAAADRYLQRSGPRLDYLTAEYMLLRGIARSRLGELDGATDDCESARSLYLILGQEERRAEACNVLGTIDLQRSRYERALRWLRESLRINESLGLQRRLGDNCLNIGIACYKRGEYEKSRLSLQRALEAAPERSNPSLRCRILLALGNVQRLRGERAAARRDLGLAYELATRQRMAREESLALEFLGDVQRDEGRAEDALRWYARARAIADRISPEGDLVAELMRREGECLAMLGRVADSGTVLERARDLAGRLGERFEEGAALRALAALEAEDAERSAELLARAIELFEEIEASHELALTHLQAARLAESRAAARDGAGGPEVERALRQALLAERLFRRLGAEEGRRQADELIGRLAGRHLERVGSAQAAGLPGGEPRIGHPAALRHARRGGGAGTGRRRDDGFVAASARIRSVLQQADAFAAFDEAVLVRGETGTGKDLLARRIHENSPRREGPFVAVNCAAVPAALFEREFFGNRRGAYTGAEADTPGYVAQAEGGTLFLDEIGELPWELQAKLLRLLQDGTYTRLGDPAEYRADVRLVAATNADLDALVAERRFRQDLHFRLKMLELVLPPLRERREDVLPLLRHFLRHYGAAGGPADYFDRRSLRLLRRYGWPGNVREVQMVARRAHIGLASEGRVRIELESGGRTLLLTGPERAAGDPDAADRRLAEALDDTGGNKAEAARLLGVSRQTVYRWLRRQESEG